MQYAKHWHRLHTFACLAGIVFGSLFCKITGVDAAAGTFPYESAIEYCRGNVTRPIALSDDRGILCFDGDILDHDFSPVEKLKENVLFVVRSPGGHIENAIALARLVRDRNAIVVVYDYCVSACAVYLFIATDQTAVRKDTLVTWHPRSSGLPDRFEWKSAGDDGPRALRTSLCDSVPGEYQKYYRKAEALSEDFLRERTLALDMFGDGLDPPQSNHVRRMLKNMLDGTGAFPGVAWMWNPRFYKNVLKTKITYESYPESQAEVDEIVARFGFRPVVFDP
jgi:hypothetical protein